MSHPVVALQTTLIAAWLADPELSAALGPDAIFDAPPGGREPPYVAVIRHDVLPRNGDGTPGNDHRLLLHCWHPDASRKSVLAIGARVIAVALAADLSSAELAVTHVQVDRTDTAIDLETGAARAAIALRVLSEPVA